MRLLSILSSLQYPISNIQPPASSIEPPVSSIQYPASSLKISPFQVSLFQIQAMPLLSHRFLPQQGELGLWKIEEDEDFFLSKLALSKAELAQVDQIKGRGRLEWLSSRWLLHTMSGRATRGVCLKDEYGKPYLINSPFQISISHSWGVAAVMAAPYSIGLDIQKYVPKITRIAHKFMRDDEEASTEETTRIEHLHIYWGAKEALYKAYGRKKLDFKEHIHIEPFAFDLANGTCKGHAHKKDYWTNFDIFYEKIADYYLVYAMEVRESS